MIRRNDLKKECPNCGDLVHPQSIHDGLCIHCERDEYPNGKPLDCDFQLLEWNE